MIRRIAFVVIAIFWVTMNVLLWRGEYGAHGGESPVPVMLVWKKILTAPDASLLSVYRNDERTGFCEFTTSVEQEMASLDEDKPPPEGFLARAGYKIRLNGNISINNFTNRIKFDGHMTFSTIRQWRDIDLKLTMRNMVVQIHASATNENVQVKVVGDEINSDFSFRLSDARDPAALLRSIEKNFGLTGWMYDYDFGGVTGNTTDIASGIQWEAHRERLMIGRDPVTAYRLETRVLEYPIVIHVSTLGEILRVELAGDVVAKLDEWSKS